MCVERGDIVGKRVARQTMALGAKLRGLNGQTGFGEAAGIFTVIGHKGGARGHNTRRDARRQRVEIGVDNRILQRVQRQLRRILRARLRA